MNTVHSLFLKYIRSYGRNNGQSCKPNPIIFIVLIYHLCAKGLLVLEDTTLLSAVLLCNSIYKQLFIHQISYTIYRHDEMKESKNKKYTKNLKSKYKNMQQLLNYNNPTFYKEKTAIHNDHAKKNLCTSIGTFTN